MKFGWNSELHVWRQFAEDVPNQNPPAAVFLAKTGLQLSFPFPDHENAGTAEEVSTAQSLR